MVKLVLKRSFFKDHIAFELPVSDANREAIKRELTKCRDKHNDYVLVTLEAPKKPRTTGKDSQCNHIHGHIQQICNETGNDFETVKYAVKMIAVEQLGYPSEIIDGRVVPQPEHLCSTVEEALLIEAAHLLAADLEIILREE